MNMKILNINKEKLYLSTIDSHAYELAQEFGLGIELAEYCTAWNLDDHLEHTDREIRKKMPAETKVIFHGPFSELFPCAIDPMIRQVCKKRFLQSVKIAGTYGCKKLVLHGGYNPHIYYPVWYVEQSPLFWKDLLKEIPKDVTICVENVFEQNPRMLFEIVKTVDEPRFQMCLDIGHAHAYGDIPVSEWIRCCKEVTGHFHLHNNEGQADSHQGLFKGTIPMRDVLMQIQEECPKATMTLELLDGRASIEALIR